MLTCPWLPDDAPESEPVDPSADEDEEFGAELLEAAQEHPFLEVVVDIETKTVSVPRLGMQASFPLDDFTRHRLMEGLDDIGLTLQHEDEITAFEARRPSYKPRIDAPTPQGV